MSDLLALWARIADNPADRAPRLVFLDWLAEQEADCHDVVRRRALQVVARGQRWQLAGNKWPIGPGLMERWGWVSALNPASDPWATGRWGSCNIHRRLHERLRVEVPVAACATSHTDFYSLPEAEWALAVAIDCASWDAIREAERDTQAGLQRYGWLAMSEHADFPQPIDRWQQTTLVDAQWTVHMSLDFRRHETRLDRRFALTRHGHSFGVLVGVCEECQIGFHTPVEVAVLPAYFRESRHSAADLALDMRLQAERKYVPPHLTEVQHLIVFSQAYRQGEFLSGIQSCAPDQTGFDITTTAMP